MDTPQDVDRGRMALRALAEALQRESDRAKSYGQMKQFLQRAGFSEEKAEYVTDTLGMFTYGDLLYVDEDDIFTELPKLTLQESELLVHFVELAREEHDKARYATRKHSGQSTRTSTTTGSCACSSWAKSSKSSKYSKSPPLPVMANAYLVAPEALLSQLSQPSQLSQRSHTAASFSGALR
jgi:hypothetical protein